MIDSVHIVGHLTLNSLDSIYYKGFINSNYGDLDFSGTKLIDENTTLELDVIDSYSQLIRGDSTLCLGCAK